MQQPALRPLGFGEILDGAFVLYRRNFAAFLAMAALPMLPLLACELTMAALQVETTAWVDRLLDAAGLLLSLLGSAALIRATTDAYGGRPVDVRAAFRTAGARYGTLVGATLAARLTIFVGLLLFVFPGIFFAIRYFAVEQAVMLEGAAPRGALHRSGALAEGAPGLIFAMMMVLLTITILPLAAQEVIAGAPGSPAGQHLAMAGNIIAGILLLPLTTAAYTLLYFDRRVRAEALDVHVAMGRLSLTG
jgi:hypothetical protein